MKGRMKIPLCNYNTKGWLLPESVHFGVLQPVHVSVQLFQIIFEMQFRQCRTHLHPREAISLVNHDL